MSKQSNITVDAMALQERDEFRTEGWVKAISPAKVNLHLAIGKKRADGYHNASTIMHALNLHDVVYLRPAAEPEASCKIVSIGDIEVPSIAPHDNLAMKAVVRLAEALAQPKRTFPVDIRIEKSVPAQAGLGGGSGNAAAALVGAATLWNVPEDHPAIEAVARTLGADVAFFLHGGCAYLEGTGDTFVNALAPSKRSIALVKPSGGVSTAEAYRRFDECPVYESAHHSNKVAAAQSADEIALFNNLAAASESIMPELAKVRAWLEARPEVEGALLCGSGAATFAVCSSSDAARCVVAAARERGWWARSTSFGSIRAAVIKGSGIAASAKTARGGCA